MTQKNRRDTDWEAELQADELGQRKEGGKAVPIVFLRGLQRLAEEAGLVKSQAEIITPSPTMVQCIYTTIFEDGTEWVGTADCNAKNCDEPFRNYPTAVAESRAEARCLRKALGIRILSAEELNLEAGASIDASPTKPVEGNIVAAITRLCDERGVDTVALIEQVVEDKSRANSIFELKQLTTVEGQKAMSYLNSLPPKSQVKVVKKKTKSREERKQELLAAQEEKSK